MAAFGLYSLALYRPLPKELLQTGVATPAVVLGAGMVGPTVETRGFGRSRCTSLTVYVDRANRMRVCPDWSTLPQGA
jgi:hypothetical protein